MPIDVPSCDLLDLAAYPCRPMLTVRTADLLRLALPGPRPHDDAIIKIRTFVMDRHDGLPHRGHPEAEELYGEMDAAIVEAVTTIHSEIPTMVARPEDIAMWVQRIGTTITLAVEASDAVRNHQDDDDREEYRPRWVDQSLR